MQIQICIIGNMFLLFVMILLGGYILFCQCLTCFFFLFFFFIYRRQEMLLQVRWWNS